MKELQSKVAIVTGGGRGIGRAICLELARQGASLAIVDVNPDGAQSVASEVQSLGAKGMPIKADVSLFGEVRLMVEKVEEEFGNIDILVNNAGGRSKPIPRAPFWETTEEGWNSGIASTLSSVFFCCRAVIAGMMKRKQGRIVSISSIDGLVGSNGAIDYSAAKAGIFGFTMSLAKEMAPWGINVNCVSPGPIDTPGAAKNSAQKLDAYKEWTGLGRLGRSEEIADMVAFLVSARADFITGQNFPVCGLANLGAWRMR